MKEKRIQKIKDFEIFYDSCESKFTALRDSDSRVQTFLDEYMLSICPGSRIGGNEKRIVEVFWGARPYEFETKGNQWKSLIETGATLFFYRNDTGDVTISIYPAKTELRQPIESQITIHEWLDPKKLKSDKFIKSLWNDFIAYMECTSLDGKPNIWQRLRISYLRNFKHLVVDKKWQPTRFSEFSKDVLKWVLTVGLSGVIIYLVTLIIPQESTEIEIQLKEVNKNLDTISIQLESINEVSQNTKVIGTTLDSIEYQTKEILKSFKDLEINKKSDRTTKALRNAGDSGKNESVSTKESIE